MVLKVKKSKIARLGARARTTTISCAHHVPSDRARNRWRWIVDDRMRDYGEIDYSRRIIRINRALHKRDQELLIDTLFHEELHRMFPMLGERAICAMTKILLPTLSLRYRGWLYSRIRNR